MTDERALDRLRQALEIAILEVNEGLQTFTWLETGPEVLKLLTGGVSGPLQCRTDPAGNANKPMIDC